jgi:hypothetical protein
VSDEVLEILRTVNRRDARFPPLYEEARALLLRVERASRRHWDDPVAELAFWRQVAADGDRLVNMAMRIKGRAIRRMFETAGELAASGRTQ